MEIRGITPLTTDAVLELCCNNISKEIRFCTTKLFMQKGIRVISGSDICFLASTRLPPVGEVTLHLFGILFLFF